MAADLNSIHSGITPTDPTLRPSWDGEQPTLRKFLEYFRNASSKLSPKMAYFVRKGVVADERNNTNIAEGPVIEQLQVQLFEFLLSSISNESVKRELEAKFGGPGGESPDGRAMLQSLQERLSDISTIEMSKIKRDIADLGRPQSATELLIDNRGVVDLAHDPGSVHARSKHIHRRHFYVRELVESGDLKVSFIPGTENVADIFTKPLALRQFTKLRALLMNLPMPRS